MINLLPPDIKTASRYARYNAVMMRYITLALAIIIVLALTQVGSRYYLNQRIKSTNASIAATKQQIASYHDLQAQATSLNARLSAIQSIQKNQNKFSELLSDLAQYMPVGTAISSVTLTGNDKQPVQLSVAAVDYKTALGFRDSIARSPRISAADIESIQASTTSSGTIYVVTVVFAFNPGDAG